MNPETQPTNTENQPSNNSIDPKASTSQSSNSVGGGMKVIQPTAPNAVPDNVTVSPQSQTIPSTNASPVIQPNPQPQGSSSPTMSVNGQSVPQINYDPSQFSEKPRRHWLRWASLSVLILLIVGAGAVLATNQNLRATVFRQKFTTYNYPLCKTHICTIKFYRGSKIASYSIPAPPGQAPSKPAEDLISPVIDGKTYIAMRIAPLKLTGTASQLLDNQYNNCSAAGETTGFTVNLQNLGTSANMCAVVTNNGTVIGYLGTIASQKYGALFDIIIDENLSFNQGQVSSSSVFDLSNYQNDIQSILASLTIKSQ